MPNRGAITIYWDGECAFCAALAERLGRFDTNRRLRLVDYRRPDIAATALPRFTFADLDAEMHALMPDGTWRIGYYAWSAALGRLPALSWLGWIMDWALFADIGPKIYRWIADRRLLISRIAGLPAPCGEGGSCRLPRAEGPLKSL
jgi:predicted DCC family thiol-disulfide oxidoreductase YuxK